MNRTHTKPLMDLLKALNLISELCCCTLMTRIWFSFQPGQVKIEHIEGMKEEEEEKKRLDERAKYHSVFHSIYAFIKILTPSFCVCVCVSSCERKWTEKQLFIIIIVFCYCSNRLCDRTQSFMCGESIRRAPLNYNVL